MLTSTLTGLAVVHLLTAAPVERRLQPIDAEASSFLWTSFNAFQENYHPRYAADDDAKTAWTEGGTGNGVGEWIAFEVGPLENTTQIRLRLRNGAQRGKKLFKATSSVKQAKVTLEPSGVTKTVNLEAAMGFQEVRLNQPKGLLRRVKLEIVSAHPGKTYEDVYLSDVQIFATSTAPEAPEVEKANFKKLKTWIKKRRDAAEEFKKGKKDYPIASKYAENSAKDCEKPMFGARALPDAAQRWITVLKDIKKADSWVPVRARTVRSLPVPEQLPLLSETKRLRGNNFAVFDAKKAEEKKSIEDDYGGYDEIIRSTRAVMRSGSKGPKQVRALEERREESSYGRMGSESTIRLLKFVYDDEQQLRLLIVRDEDTSHSQSMLDDDDDSWESERVTSYVYLTWKNGLVDEVYEARVIAGGSAATCKLRHFKAE